MKFKDVAISDASTEAKVAALAVLLDKELLKLAETVLNVQAIQGPQGEQGLQGPKGEQGDRGFDGTNGKDGSDGKDGKDGAEGKQGVGVADAKIDFDGSLVITLTDGTEINAGEIVPLDTAEKIRVIGNGGGTSQSVLDSIAAIQATIATYGTMATQNANAVAITGGSINGTTVGSTTPAAGTFTTLTATGQTSLGGVAGSESLRVLTPSVTGARLEIQSFSGSTQLTGEASSGVVDVVLNSRSSGSVRFRTAGGTEQARVSHTASAVNYVQVTGAATTGAPVISAQGSDASVQLRFSAKGTQSIRFDNNNTANQIFRIDGSATNSVNYLQASGANTTLFPVLSAQGSDTNISQVFQSKGTGAIDLAAGSSGVNISNGGTVTALTRTGAGTGYTSPPTVAITAPTTAGGVQATASAFLQLATTPTITSGGTGYTVNDVLTFVGGTIGLGATASAVTVTSVSGGVITGISINQFGTGYSTVPTNPISVTGGTGSGATFTVSGWQISAFTITNAGSGYVEQPTVSFSGGGGSGAAAYAIVGGTSVIKGIGQTGIATIDFQTPQSITASVPAMRIRDNVSDSYPMVSNTGGLALFVAQGNATAGMGLAAASTGNVRFFTNGTSLVEQLRVAHTASAVNYVQVTGAATGAGAAALGGVLFTGSDTNVNGAITTKGVGYIAFAGGGSTSTQAFRVITTNASSSGNLIAVQGAAAGSSPSIQAISGAGGSDTNIDLTLTPKGTGNVRFGTYTATISAITGYIEIKDSGGTVRRLAVVA